MQQHSAGRRAHLQRSSSRLRPLRRVGTMCTGQAVALGMGGGGGGWRRYEFSRSLQAVVISLCTGSLGVDASF